ncbi:MAG: hypothetical protein GC187_10550 [Alphaproteobacteria bacterium]|nr:hypothetical protein [Alphaproteobacteria bacterium]
MFVYLGPSIESGFNVNMRYKALDGKSGPVIVSVEFIQDVLRAHDNFAEAAEQASGQIGSIAEKKYAGSFPVTVTSDDR